MEAPHPSLSVAGGFACTDRQCLPQERQCDGVDDCNDGADERLCGQWQGPCGTGGSAFAFVTARERLCAFGSHRGIGKRLRLCSQ